MQYWVLIKLLSICYVIYIICNIQYQYFRNSLKVEAVAIVYVLLRLHCRPCTSPVLTLFNTLLLTILIVKIHWFKKNIRKIQKKLMYKKKNSCIRKILWKKLLRKSNTICFMTRSNARVPTSFSTHI